MVAVPVNIQLLLLLLFIRCSCVGLFATSWTAQQASLSITSPQSLLGLMTVESVTPSNHRILCRPLLLLLSIPPSIRVFSDESALRIRWPKYRCFSFLKSEFDMVYFTLRYWALISSKCSLESIAPLQGLCETVSKHLQNSQLTQLLLQKNPRQCKRGKIEKKKPDLWSKLPYRYLSITWRLRRTWNNNHIEFCIQSRAHISKKYVIKNIQIKADRTSHVR